MKKILLSILLSFFLLFSIHSQTLKRELEKFITFYGYEVSAMPEEISNVNYLTIETIDYNYNEYEHITYIIAVSRALIKFLEIYNFDLDFFHVIKFKSGKFHDNQIVMA